jgi:hypothetical protein
MGEKRSVCRVFVRKLGRKIPLGKVWRIILKCILQK